MKGLGSFMSDFYFEPIHNDIHGKACNYSSPKTLQLCLRQS